MGAGNFLIGDHLRSKRKIWLLHQKNSQKLEILKNIFESPSAESITVHDSLP